MRRARLVRRGLLDAAPRWLRPAAAGAAGSGACRRRAGAGPDRRPGRALAVRRTAGPTVAGPAPRSPGRAVRRAGRSSVCWRCVAAVAGGRLWDGRGPARARAITGGRCERASGTVSPVRWRSACSAGRHRGCLARGRTGSGGLVAPLGGLLTVIGCIARTGCRRRQRHGYRPDAVRHRGGDGSPFGAATAAALSARGRLWSGRPAAMAGWPLDGRLRRRADPARGTRLSLVVSQASCAR